MKRNKVFSAIVGALAATALSTLVQAASVTPNTTLDGSAPTPDCTLREAITSVNTNTASGGCVSTGSGAIDTVELPAGDYILDITGTEDGNASGDLDALTNITINGAGASSTSISAQGLEDGGTPERVLHITAQQVGSLTATIRGVTIRDGLETSGFGGGGILIAATLPELGGLNIKLGISSPETTATLEGVVVTENDSDIFGGGVASLGANLFIQMNSEITSNSSRFGGGVLGTSAEDTPTSLEISDSLIDGNEAQIGAGVASIGENSELLIQTSTISNNGDACFGGGVAAQGVGLVIDSTINNNSATGPCPSATGGAETLNTGGGIAVDSSTSLTVVNSTISGNSAINGGGGIVVNVSEPAPPPAPIKFGTIAQVGLHLFNATIVENEVEGFGGGVGIITIDSAGDAAVLTSANTIIADNSAGDGSPDCQADFVSAGYNLIGDVEGCNGFTGTGDQTGVDPELGPLQDNGGPTETHALLEGSPAIDTANPAGCDDGDGGVLSADQRGSTRPVNATGLATAICDIGAYEFQVEAPPTPTPTPGPGFLLNGTGCALTLQGDAANSMAILALFAGLSALGYRALRRRA